MQRGPATGSLSKVDAAQIRAANSSHLLRLIWRERTISRADLARRTRLSPSTVSAIVSGLLSTGLVRVTGTGSSRGGRKPVLLGFNDDAMLLAGVDIGATHVAVVLTNLGGETLVWRDARHPVRDDPIGTLSLVERELRLALEEAHASTRALVGVGISAPSPVAPGEDALSPLILPAWRGLQIKATLQEALKVPVWLENDANLGALAELWWGAGRDGADLAFIKVATGVGAGLIVNGEIYRGLGGFAGEIGHTSVDLDGEPCLCGLRGCLVTYIGSEALLERARQEPEGPLGAPEHLDALVDAALAGDPSARRLISEAGRYLGVALANLLSLLNPPTVVVGGGLTRCGDLLLEPLHNALTRRTLWPTLAQASVIPSEMGERVCALGAATLVLQAALSDPNLFFERAQA